VVADLPFGSYQAGPGAALASAVRHLKEGGAQAVKLEGGRRVLPQVEALTGAGIPVMAHLGLTPQSVNVLGGSAGYRAAVTLETSSWRMRGRSSGLARSR